MKRRFLYRFAGSADVRNQYSQNGSGLEKIVYGCVMVLVKKDDDDDGDDVCEVPSS